ncbi:hypothetical protein AHAS_Ahas15G0171900 [Arachis hypogaea]
MVSDVNFPSNVFCFTPNDLILNHTNAQSSLIDVMGLLTAKDPAYNLEDDLPNRSTYKPICELKELIENGSYVTIGTILAIDSKNGWWYKGSKQCFYSPKESDTSYHCTTCDTFPSSHTPR